MALFLAISLVLLGLWSFRVENKGKIGIFGGPETVPEIASTLAEAAGAVAGQPRIEGAAPSGSDAPLQIKSESLAMGAIEGLNSPFGVGSESGKLLIYKVRSGDTLSKIAENFGITVETITGSNPQVRSKSLKVGQELEILPVSGVLYRLKDGESVEAVAAAYRVSVAQLKEFNRSVNLASASEGTTIVIPGAAVKSAAVPPLNSTKLPSVKNYFVSPANGFNWGNLHKNNAVDIANSCGTSVIAAAEGLVSEVKMDGWNGGYGAYVEMEHPNGTRTKYAHLSKEFVAVGDYLEQGGRIGLMGDTGESTGCHLHFEVVGAKNPFAK